MSSRGCTPVEIPSLLGFRDYDFVVRCLELLRHHIPAFAPECATWEIKVIALCHHHPANRYPAVGVFDCGEADWEMIERFGNAANEWVSSQSLGWLLDASKSVAAASWQELCEDQ